MKPTRKSSWFWMLLGIGVLVLAGGGPARAAGLLIAEGGLGGVLEIESHEVRVTINNGVAVTEVTQVFRNKERRPVEALYTFPVPRGASVSDFTMWINGKEMTGEVLERARAREIYESYKRVNRDPGLLEQTNYKTFEMRIFPIAAEAQQKVRIVYSQEIDAERDWATYVYPLATVTRTGLNARTTGSFRMTVRARSAIPVAEVASPSHADDFAVARHSPDFFEAAMEVAGGDLNRDIVVAYRLERPRTGVDLVASKGEGDEGYFMMTLSTGRDLPPVEEAMDYVFLLDVSGSMREEGKLLVSTRQLAAFVQELPATDRFEIVTFNVGPQVLFDRLAPATENAKARAEAFLESREARGGTILAPALQKAYLFRDPDRPLNVIVVSDGMTEQAEVAELARLIAARPAGVRVFALGVGNEVNRGMLEDLARQAGGLADFLSPEDDFERRARIFRQKLIRPVATNLSVRFSGGDVYDLVPGALPNLYQGSPVRIYGRYRRPGPVTATITGKLMGRDVTETAAFTFPASDDDNPEIERMWAWHRIDELLKEADRGGSREAVKGEIVRLGELYSIATEYTSFLVLENDAEYRRWRIERKNLLRAGRDRAAQERRQASLDAIRGRAVAGLGPEVPGEEAPEGAPVPPASAAPGAPPASAASAPQAERRGTGQGWDFGGRGSGPVGPLFVWMAMWMRNRKRRRAAGCRASGE